MRIALLIADASRSGGPRHVLNLATGLKELGVEPTIFMPTGSMHQLFLQKELSVQTVTFRGKFDVFGLTKLKGMLKIGNFDLLHCHGVRGGLYGRLAGKGRLPVVYTEHLWTKEYHLQHRLNETLQLDVLRFLDRFTAHTVAVSQAVRNFLLSAKITTKEKSSVIYQGIPFPQPRKQEASNVRLHRQRTIPRIMFVGSLTRRKGPDLFIAALAALRNSGQPVKGELVGSGPLLNDLKQLAKLHRLSDSILFHGEVVNPSELVSQATVYVNAARDEAFGLGILEAMHAGVPVVATDVGGVPELVGNAAKLIPPNDAPALARAIAQLLKDKEEMHRLSTAGKLQARKFSIAHMAEAHLELYKKTLN